MRVIGFITLLFIAIPEPALGEAQHGTYTGASNTGEAVTVEAQEVSTTDGVEGSHRGGGRPRVDPRAVYSDAYKTMLIVLAYEIPVRTAESAGYQDLRRAGGAGAALAALGGRIEARRSAWNAEWAGLNRRAHDAWRAFSTACETIRQTGDSRIQECSYDAWRNYSAGSFERTLGLTPPRPPEALILQARDQVRPAGPAIGMSPRVEWEQIVNFPSWMWIESSGWQSKTARAEAGGAWAEATATPSRVVWDMGNGDQVVCPGPGAVYDEQRPESEQRTDCTYTYRQSSAGRPDDAYTVTATLVYDVSWQGSGGAGGDLGTLSRSSAVSVRVAELQALVQ